MTNWMSGFRGGVFMVGLWVVGWSIGFGGLIELLVDPDGEILDVWPTVLAIPGLIGGALFAGLLAVAEGRRSYDQVPLARFATWGAVIGALLGAMALGIAIGTDPTPLENGLGMTVARGSGLIAAATGLGAIAGFGSGVFFWLLSRARMPAEAGRAG